MALSNESKDLFRRLLRHGIDANGNLTSDSYVRLYNSTVIYSYFDEYDDRENTFVESPYSVVFDFAKRYYEEYAKPPSDDLLLNNIVQHKALDSAQKSQYRTIILEISRMDAKPGDVGYLIDAVRKEAVDRATNMVLTHSLEVRKNKGGDAQRKYISEQLALLSGHSKGTRQQIKTYTAGEMARAQLEMLEKGVPMVNIKAAYGIPTVDARTMGLAEAETAFIAGPSNSGKSFCTYEIGYHNAVELERRVVFASLEMDRATIINRLISRQTGIPSNKLRKGGDALEEEEYETVKACLREIETHEDRYMFIEKGSFSNLTQLRSVIHDRYGVDHKIDLLCLDYLDKLEPIGDKNSADWEKMRKVSHEFYTMNGEEGWAGLSPTQNNSAGMENGGNDKKGRKVGIEGLAWRSLYKDADTFFMLTTDPDDPPVGPTDPMARGVAGGVVMTCIKSRAGGKDWEAHLRANFAIAHMKEGTGFHTTDVDRLAQAKSLPELEEREQ